VSDYSGTANNAERSISSQRVINVLKEKQELTVIQGEVQHATDMITGATGGVIKINFGGNGQTAELLILDTGNISTAQDVWRMNQGGFGHSGTGYAGPYTTAITADGHVVADVIAGNKISGVKFESNPATGSGQEPQVIIEDGAVVIKRVTFNGSGEITSTTDIGDISYISRSQADGTDSIAIRVGSGKTVTIGMPNNAEFVYYSDTSQAPSGAEKFNFFGNIRFYSNLIGDFVDLAALERRVYDLEHPT
jgi:phage-related protein